MSRKITLQVEGSNDDEVVRFEPYSQTDQYQQSYEQYAMYESHPQNAFQLKSQNCQIDGGGHQIIHTAPSGKNEEYFENEEEARSEDPRTFYFSKQAQSPQKSALTSRDIRQRELEKSGFIMTLSQENSLSKQQLNQKLVQGKLFKQIPSQMTKFPSHDTPIGTAHKNVVFGKHMNPSQTSSSPSSKVRMSPRTTQPSNTAATVPIPPSFSLKNLPTKMNYTRPVVENIKDANFMKGYEGMTLEPSLSSNPTSGISDDFASDKVFKDQARHLRAQMQQANQEKPLKSHTGTMDQFEPNRHQILSFGIETLNMTQMNQYQTQQRGGKKIQQQSVGVNQFGQSIDHAHSQERVFSHQQLQIDQSSAKDVKESFEFGKSREQVLAQQNVATIDVSEQTSRILSQGKLNDFILKQQEFEQRKTNKIRKALDEKHRQEQAEFAKNATFKPKINLPIKTRNPKTGVSRTLQQFIKDQESYVSQAQKKLDEHRAKKNLDEVLAHPGKPKLNPKSEKICQKIQAEYYAQMQSHESIERSQQQENSIRQNVSTIQEDSSQISEVGRTSMPKTTNTSQITTAVPYTKSKKLPNNANQTARVQKSPSHIQQLVKQKKDLAKQVPEMPTFAPKINNRSQKIANQIQKRRNYEYNTQHIAQKEFEEPLYFIDAPLNPNENNYYVHRNIALDIVGSDISTQIIRNESPIMEEGNNFQLPSRRQTDYQAAGQTTDSDLAHIITGRKRLNTIKLIKQARTPQAYAAVSDQSQFVFPADSQNVSRRSKHTSKSRHDTSQNLSSNSKSRQEPRIAVLKAQTQQLKTQEDRKKHESQSRKHNENLVLRNFRKEYDAVMFQLGLGLVQIKDEKEQVTHQKQPQQQILIGEKNGNVESNIAQQTVQYLSAQSHEYLSEESIRVDVAELLHCLGFLKEVYQAKDPSKPLFGTFIAVLDDNEQKRAFKTNLFTVLAAIQSINLKDHYRLFEKFGILQNHVLEDITQQADIGSQLGTGQALSSAKNRHDKGVDQSTESVLCPESLLIQALMYLALQPFPFSLSHQHLVKMHLTFMKFYLNRKDNISQGYRQSLEAQEFNKFKFTPEIAGTQTSFSPNKQRVPLTEPNRYYDEIKKNIKERSAKLSSLKAEKERTMQDQCTFKPHVSLMSTKIAYKRVKELHVPQKEFSQTYMAVQETETVEETDSQQRASSRDRLALGLPEGENGLSSRLSSRITKLMREFVNDKLSGKKQDITTEQKEFEKSRNELKFRPDIAKSQLSLQLAMQKSSSNKSKEHLLRKSPTTMEGRIRASPKGKPSSPLDLKQKSIMFNKQADEKSAKTKETYGAQLKNQLFRRKKSPNLNKAKSNLVQKRQMSPVVQINLGFDVGYHQQKDPDHFPSTDKRNRQNEPIIIQNRQSDANPVSEHYMPEVTAYTNQISQEQHQLMFDQDQRSEATSNIEQSTANFDIPQLRAPPSVMDLNGFTLDKPLQLLAQAQYTTDQENEDFAALKEIDAEESRETLVHMIDYKSQGRSDEEDGADRESYVAIVSNKIDFLQPVEEDISSYKSPQQLYLRQKSLQQQKQQLTQQLIDSKVPYESARSRKEPNFNYNSQLQNVSPQSIRQNRNLFVIQAQIDSSKNTDHPTRQSQSSRDTTEFPNALLVANYNDASPSPSQEVQNEQPVSTRVSNSNGEWTAEFAKVVDDVITIENTVSIANRNSPIGSLKQKLFQKRNSPSSSLVVPEPFKRDNWKSEQQKRSSAETSMKKLQLQADPRESHKKLQLAESLNEQEIANENEKEIQNGRDDCQIVQEPISQQKGPSIASTVSGVSFKTGQMYHYVNESQSEDDTQERHQFIDSTIQLGMIGEKIDLEEERMRHSGDFTSFDQVRRNEDMPRLEKSLATSQTSGRVFDIIQNSNQKRKQLQNVFQNNPSVVTEVRVSDLDEQFNQQQVKEVTSLRNRGFILHNSEQLLQGMDDQQSYRQQLSEDKSVDREILTPRTKILLENASD